MTPAAVILAAALLLIPGPACADTVVQIKDLPDHVVAWDEANDRPATVNLWKDYLPDPQNPVRNVTVDNRSYHLIEYKLDEDYFDSPFAHDIVIRLIPNGNGGDEPDLDSVDHV
ncbi:MAG: hypothetical protein ABGY09_01645, partial [Euryarchaeota archaeon]